MNIFSKLRLEKPKEGRIVIIDAIRGVCILLMIAYHFGFDLVLFDIIPEWVLYNWFLNTLQPLFAGIFIFVSGISSRFSRSNIKRGIIALCFAAAVSAVSFIAGEPILFGILHFIGFATIIYGVFQKQFDRLFSVWFPVICAVLFAILYYIVMIRFFGQAGLPHLWALGITDAEFVSTDYFPVFPWIFLFLAGTWFGKLVISRELPSWFYNFTIPFFPAAGRYTLIIYLVHQPVCMAIVWIISRIKEMLF